MLNEEKVKYMTKAASYENGPEKKNVNIDAYFRGDYLGLQLVKSGIAYTAAFLIIAALGVMSRMEEILLQISQPSYLNRLVRILVVVYAVGLVLYEIAVSVYYAKKYQRAKESVKDFQTYLKKIHKFYETEDSAEEEKEADEESGL